MNRASTSSTTGDAASSTTDSTPNFCGHCGEPDDGGSRPPSDPHLPCRELLVLEPPRYCAACGRRMKVRSHRRAGARSAPATGFWSDDAGFGADGPDPAGPRTPVAPLCPGVPGSSVVGGRGGQLSPRRR